MATREIIADVIAESKKIDKQVQGMSPAELKAFKKEQINAGRKSMAILADLAFLGITGGLIGAGGKLVYRGLKGAQAMAAARKAIDTARRAAKSRKDYKPATATKPKTQTKPATTAKKPQDKPKEQPKKLTQQPKKIPKKKPGTAVTVTKPTPKPKRTAQPKTKEMKKANVVSSTTRTPKKVTGPAKPAPKPKKTLTKKQKAAIAAAVITGGAAGVKIATTKKPAEADPTPKKRTPKGGYVRPKPPGSGKKITSVVGTGETGPDKSMPKAGKRASNRTNISAGPNTGFGLKGNIFPSNAKERRELMAKFGGTGSRAAKAAMAGTQGNIKRKKK